MLLPIRIFPRQLSGIFIGDSISAFSFWQILDWQNDKNHNLIYDAITIPRITRHSIKAIKENQGIA